MSFNKPKSHRIEKVNYQFHWYKILYRISNKIKRGGLFLILKIQTLISWTPVDFLNASASLLRTNLMTFSYQLLSIFKFVMMYRTDSHSPSLSDRKINDVSTKNNALSRKQKRYYSSLFNLQPTRTTFLPRVYFILCIA